MKTYFVNQSWKKLTGIFTIPVHQKSGRSNSKYATFTTTSVNMHDAYLKIAPDACDKETGKIIWAGNVLMRVQVDVSQSDPQKKIIKILVYPLPNREASHEVEFIKLPNALGINLKPLAKFVNDREQKYSQICKITKQGLIKKTEIAEQLEKLGIKRAIRKK